LRLPDLDRAKSAVLNSLTSADAQRGYRHAIDEFVEWYCSEPRLSFNRTVVLRYRIHLEARRLAPGLRRHEAVELTVSDLQRREDHWAIVDLIGKASHIRTIPVPHWVKNLIDDWLQSAGISNGRIFRRVTRAGTVWGSGLTEKAVWHVVRQYARKAGIDKLAPHDLRRTCARLCHQAGGELDQIQFLLGHVSVQTTERYLGCKQRIRNAVNDSIGIQPKRRMRSDG